MQMNEKVLRDAVTEYQWAQELLIGTAYSKLSYQKTIETLQSAINTENGNRERASLSAEYHSPFDCSLIVYGRKQPNVLKMPIKDAMIILQTRKINVSTMTVLCIRFIPVHAPLISQK